CGNFLMAYTSKNLEMTIASIETLAQRLSDKGQIRIYPGGSAFERIEAELQEALFRKGLHLDVVPSEHRFVKGWDAMYRITKMSLGPGPQ
ncbi:MAG: hypothetical protein KDD62_07420, partial [Bdellovibrionales bacterium]|nr:hypothetical protein [Bdellovibrionales bacterium]